MQAPEKVYMVIEKRADGTETIDPFEFKTPQDAQERMAFLIENAKKNGVEGSSFEVTNVIWLHEIK